MVGLRLHTKNLERLTAGEDRVFVGRLCCGNAEVAQRQNCISLVNDENGSEDSRNYAHLYVGEQLRPTTPLTPNSFRLSADFNYLSDGDIVRINPARHSLHVLYRKNSSHNSLLVTERCDNFCLMCSQPPKEADDSFIVAELLDAIPLMDKATASIGVTGGEPTLLGTRLVTLIRALRDHLPNTAVHVLSNGRSFSRESFVDDIARLNHPALMFGIPVYSDIASLHDHVVQARGAFTQTIDGILNLKERKVRVELRIVLHKLTIPRLPELAAFITRNLLFVDHVALMGLEMMGFTKLNLTELWIDPFDYRAQLTKACDVLATAGVNVSVYNHQLCVLPESLWQFNKKSISDWKNVFLPECESCLRQDECGGFFASSRSKFSSHIRAFRTANGDSSSDA